MRVNPGFLAGQGIDPGGDLDKIWAQRFQAIRSWEAHLKSSKTTVVKFFLNVSKEEQRARLLAPEGGGRMSVTHKRRNRNPCV